MGAADKQDGEAGMLIRYARYVRNLSVQVRASKKLWDMRCNGSALRVGSALAQKDLEFCGAEVYLRAIAIGSTFVDLGNSTARSCSYDAV